MRYLPAILLLACWPALAQMSEYRKIMEERRSMDLTTFHTRLKEYQQANEPFCNIYFQLGEVEMQLFSDLDPITDRIGSRQYIHNASNFYTLAKGYFDVKEAVKNPDWFNFGRIKDRDSLTLLLQNEMDTKYSSVTGYADVYEALVENYDMAVLNYLAARQGFIEIANSYSSLSELFLKADQSLKDKVTDIGVKFDSSLYYLDVYRDAYQKLPYMNPRTATVVLKDIEQFRMNGISPSNFLADEIALWDYGAWSENLSDLIENEVDGLKSEVESAYDSFLLVNQKMIYGEECIQINVDDLKAQRIVNIISKYDERSILIDVFNYARDKMTYGNQLVYERNCNELSDLVTTDELLSRKARNLQTIHQSYLQADSAAQSVLSSTRNQDYFEWFYSAYMPGEAGSVDYMQVQIAENSESFKNMLAPLATRKAYEPVGQDIKVSYALADSILTQGGAGDDAFQVVFNKQLSDSLMIVYGQRGAAYQCIGITPENGDFRMLWQADVPAAVTAYKALSDSSFVLVGSGRRPQITHLYSSGRGKADFAISADSVINITYNELLATYTVLAAADADSVITFQEFNHAGKLSNNKSLSSRGAYLHSFTNDQNIWMMGMTEAPDGAVIHAKVYDQSYQEIASYAYEFPVALQSPKVIKNDDQTLTVVGDTSVEDEIIYALLDYEGNIKSLSTF